MTNEIVLEKVRLSYVSLWEPRPTLSGAMKYCASVLIPQTDKNALAACKKAIEEAIDGAVKIGKLSKAQRTIVQSPLRDGTKEYEVEKKDANYKGYIFFNAYSDHQPSLVDSQVNRIFNREEIYSGIIAAVAVTFYFTNKGGEPRVAVSLNHVLKEADADRMDGRTNVAEAFAKFVTANTEGATGGDLT